MQLTLNDLGQILKNDNNNNGDYSFIGEVSSVIADGSGKIVGYNVQIGDSILEARKLAGAQVGDTVLCTTLTNGITMVTGRIGGDGDVIAVQEEVDDISGEITVDLREITQKVNQANQTANEADQVAGQANQTANQASQTANQALNTANSANQTAGQALTTANAISGVANQALNAATTAQSTANETKKYFFQDFEGTHIATLEGEDDDDYNINAKSGEGIALRYDEDELLKVNVDEISGEQTSGQIFKIKNKHLDPNERFSLKFYGEWIDGHDKVYTFHHPFLTITNSAMIYHC